MSGENFCNKRRVWTVTFLFFLVFAFTFHLIALLTPSWQFVYLEDGRTEHHHGLWLDCKRDYSNEYGKPREYYESLYRITHFPNPLDQFWLPQLQCVYKFDYWLDDEDWYEHGYDENKLQGDAYQHLFIGWKIAAFTAHSFALLISLTAIIILLWSFCHKLLICVASVLVTLSLLATMIGNGIFFMFSNYQDNNIIKENDEIYEQYFGYSFYSALIGNFFLLATSVIGCSATFAVLSVRKENFVKIKIDGLNQNKNDNQINGNKKYKGNNKKFNYNKNVLTNNFSTNPLSNNKFQRSKSAVYKVDSKALKDWEQEIMGNVAFKNPSRNNFKRTNSLPNIEKKTKNSRNLHQPFSISSNSDIASTLFTEITCPPALNFSNTTTEFIPSTSRQQLNNFEHFTSKDPDVLTQQTDLIYEYVDENLMSNKENSFTHFKSNFNSIDSKIWKNNLEQQKNYMLHSTSINTYDQVPFVNEQFKFDNNDYLKPKSIKSNNTSESNSYIESPIINSLNNKFTCFAVTNSEFLQEEENEKKNNQKIFCNELRALQEKKMNQKKLLQRELQFQNQNSTFFAVDNSMNSKNYELESANLQQTQKDLKNYDKNQQTVKYPKIPPKPPQRTSLLNCNPLPSAPYLTIKNHQKNSNNLFQKKNSEIPSYLQINTFQTENGVREDINYNVKNYLNKNSNNNRSLVNLVAINSNQTPSINVFDQRESIDYFAELKNATSTFTNQKSNKYSKNLDTFKEPTKTIKETNFNGNEQNFNLKKKNSCSSIVNYQLQNNKNSTFIESERNRSIGSSVTNFQNNNNSFSYGLPLIFTDSENLQTTKSNLIKSEKKINRTLV